MIKYFRNRKASREAARRLHQQHIEWAQALRAAVGREQR